METPVFIHVGFGNSGTTSLQRNFFARRDDIFYAGEPYGERGGIFTAIKCVEDFNFDSAYFKSRCDGLIYARHNSRPIVISDESLCDTPQLYFAPYAMPRDVIAWRLHRFFPAAKIIFTIRNQRDYVASMYLNLKRNAALFDCMPVPPFSHWLAGSLAAARSRYLQNLDFMESIALYGSIFGRENICVLPLESAITDGSRTYLTKLCDFMGLRVTEHDIRNFASIQNRRLSERQEMVTELMHGDRFRRLFAELGKSLGGGRLDAFLDEGPRATIDASPEDDERIRRQVGTGNWLLAREFCLDLKRYGYPWVDAQNFTACQLALAEQATAYRTDVAQLRGLGDSADTLEMRRATEIMSIQTRLNQLASEMAVVGQSPVWQIVKRLDSARRILSRAAAVALHLV